MSSSLNKPRLPAVHRQAQNSTLDDQLIQTDLSKEANMAIMLKIRWDIKSGMEDEFRENQQALCEVMSDDHPGVICYHVDYPSPSVSEWVEIYANDDVFKAHLANAKGGQPLGSIIEACDNITCRCWGNPDEESREILKGFGTEYQNTAESSFSLHGRADRNSSV